MARFSGSVTISIGPPENNEPLSEPLNVHSLFFQYSDGSTEIFYSEEKFKELEDKYGGIVEEIIRGTL